MNTFIKKLWVLVALALPLLPAQSTVNAQTYAAGWKHV